MKHPLLVVVPILLAACQGSNAGGTDARDAETSDSNMSAIDAGSSEDAQVPGDAAAEDVSTPMDAGRPDAFDPNGALPSGDNGIAARHPRDENITSDPAVIFADDFESYGSGVDLGDNWDAVYHNASITTALADVHAGLQALQFTSPQQSVELSNGVGRTLLEEKDILFLRFYSKFAASFDVVGSSHNGGGISAHYFVDGNATPGVPADGTNKFLIEFESWRGEPSEANPGSLNVYIYHPEQRSQWGDHFFPDGTVLPNTSIPGDFGPSFEPRPQIVVELDRWYAYEVMLKANTPDQRDGRVACWLDGELIADFKNLRLRDVATLTIDRFNLSLHIGSNTAGETHKWYDDVVVATEYIGPRFDP